MTDMKTVVQIRYADFNLQKAEIPSSQFIQRSY